MNRTKIEWADFTWNPIVGCGHGCGYCYARALNDRFKWIKDWNTPEFFPERLNDPDLDRKKPAIIFVGSMCDIFAPESKPEWVEEILKVVEKYPQHIFMFLTKNPSGYRTIRKEWPQNCWLGTTVESIKSYDQKVRLATAEILRTMTGNKTFLSIEPIQGAFTFAPLKNDFNLIIVGAMTNFVASPPPPKWIDSIRHPNIFFKENIRVHHPHLPKGDKSQIWNS